MTCTFTQGGAANNTVTRSGNGQTMTVTLNIQTDVATARLDAMPPLRPGLPQNPPSPILPAIVLGWPGCLAGLAAALGRRRKGEERQIRVVGRCLLVLLTVASARGLSSCSGGGAITPAGTTTIMVTATPSAGNGQTSQASQSLALSVTITR